MVLNDSPYPKTWGLKKIRSLACIEAELLPEVLLDLLQPMHDSGMELTLHGTQGPHLGSTYPVSTSQLKKQRHQKSGTNPAEEWSGPFGAQAQNLLVSDINETVFISTLDHEAKNLVRQSTRQSYMSNCPLSSLLPVRYDGERQSSQSSILQQKSKVRWANSNLPDFLADV